MKKRMMSLTLVVTLLLSGMISIKAEAASCKVLIPEGYRTIVGYEGQWIKVHYFIKVSGKENMSDSGPDWGAKMIINNPDKLKEAYGERNTFICKKAGKTSITIQAGKSKKTVKVVIKKSGLNYPKIVYSSGIGTWKEKDSRYILKGYGDKYKNYKVTSGDPSILTVKKLRNSSGKVLYYVLHPQKGKAGIVPLTVATDEGEETIEIDVRKKLDVRLLGYKTEMDNGRVVGIRVTIKNYSKEDIVMQEMGIRYGGSIRGIPLNRLIKLKPGVKKTIRYHHEGWGFIFNSAGEMRKGNFFELDAFVGGKRGFIFLKQDGTTYYDPCDLKEGY
ncbi:MAG: hypothetical protein E7280_11350 [Lachnospiraceae bacterium]|nr:hypothetical protein [Lachnospiraceae bacterium]